MSYQEIMSVSEMHDGLPVRLKLQLRLNVPPTRYRCLSWRTLYPSGLSNRRFYRTNDGFWTIPMSVALRLMQRADECGMLGSEYDDSQTRHRGPNNLVNDSRLLPAPERIALFDEITLDRSEPNWGPDPLFIVIQVPDDTWRKVMIIDSGKKFCTFRSLTIEEDYKPVIVEGTRSIWRLDNAMQDASAAMIREFLSVLRTL